MLIRKKLTDAEFSNPALRYDETCDCVQFSPDGGTTWVDQPTLDPRSSDAYRLPPLTGTDEKCRAAEGMTELVRLMVNARINDITDAELAGTILGIVAFIPGFNVLWALILAFVSLAFTIARELLEAAFPEEVYDQLRCLFYCGIGEDGQMSQEQFDAIYADLIDFDTIARTWIQAVMNLVGAVGMSNAGVHLEAAADCDCECAWCYEFDFSIDDGGWSPLVNVYGTYGTYIAGSWWRSNFFPTPAFNNYQQINLTLTFSTTLTEIEVYTEFGTGSPQTRNVYVNREGGTNIFVSSASAGDNTDTWTGSQAVTALTIGTSHYPTGSTSYTRLKRVVLRGTGDNPFGMDNCE